MSFFKVHPDHTTLVLDIDSGSVGAGLVGIKKDALPELLYSKRLSFSLDEDVFSGTLEEAMLWTLREVLTDIFKVGLKEIKKKGFPHTSDHAVVTLGSPWCDISIRERKMSSIKAFEYNEKFAHRLVHSEEEVYERELNRIREPGDYYEVFSSHITSLRLNGYKTEVNTKKKASNLEMEMVTSASKKRLLMSIEEEIGRTIGLKRGICFQNLSNVLKSAVTNFSHANFFLLFEFSDENTNLLTVHNGEIRGATSIPLGVNTLARAIGEEFGEPLALSRSRLAIFSRGEFDDEKMSKIDQILTDMEAKWQALCINLPEEYKTDTVFVSSRKEFSLVAEALARSVLPKARITSINKENYELQILNNKCSTKDETIGYVAAFSASLLSTK